jgi:GT2 family glycosyltransferase
MTEPKVAAVVLNYNGKEVTLETLASLRGLRYGQVDLVVVDNGSTDGSWDAVAAAYPDVTQLRVEDNQGISWGLNDGLRWALERDYDYVLAMNNDVEADPEMLAELVAAIKADPEVGCVGPKTYYFWDRQRLWSAGGVLRFKESVTRERGDGELDRGQYDCDQEVDYVNGCAVLMRREALLAAGLWDPVYYLGVEDADWCVRMKRRGWRCLYAHRARLWHKVSHSIGVYKPGRTFHTGRSTAIFVRKYARPWQWLTFLLFYAASLPLAWVREVRKGNQAAVWSKLRGVREGLRVPLPPPPAAPGL